MADKKILIIISQSGYGNSRAKEALDIALTLAAFEQEIALLMTGDAPFLLLKAQQPELIDQKNIANSFAALPMYDIDKVYIDQISLTTHHLTSDQMTIPYLASNPQQMAQLIRESDVVLRF